MAIPEKRYGLWRSNDTGYIYTIELTVPIEPNAFGYTILKYEGTFEEMEDLRHKLMGSQKNRKRRA